jgi:hypothetical protein
MPIAASRTGDERSTPSTHRPQVLVQVLVAVRGQCRLVHRRAVGDDHENAPRFGAGQQPAVRPAHSLAVDVLLQDLS